MIRTCIYYLEARGGLDNLGHPPLSVSDLILEVGNHSFIFIKFKIAYLIQEIDLRIY